MIFYKASSAAAIGQPASALLDVVKGCGKGLNGADSAAAIGQPMSATSPRAPSQM